MKFLSFNNNAKTILLTLLFVVFLGAIYLFIYIPNNEQRLQQRRFRTLQNINKNIEEKIKNSNALLDNLEASSDTAYINYLNANAKENFVIILSPVQKKGAADVVQSDSGYQLTTNHLTRQVTLIHYKVGMAANGDTVLINQIAMKFSADQFFKSLLPSYVFDEYVIFNKGLPFYETLSFGNDLRDSVFADENKLIASSVRNYNISGVNYKLFLQPVTYIPGNEWVVSGLLKQQRYGWERNQLPSSVVLLLVTIVLVILILYPWIKLYQMGNKDRLTTADGIASIAVSMLLMSILFFTFFKYNIPLRPSLYKDSKKVISEKITASFLGEINKAYASLYFIDTVTNTHRLLFQNKTKDSSLATTLNKQDSGSLQKIISDTSVSQIYWLNANGIETVKWTAEKINGPKGNYRGRAYFETIARGQGSQLAPRKLFYLDQVISWVRGKFTTVIAIPSSIEGQTAAVMSFDMKSLSRPILPPGYHFAVINQAGKVLYHTYPSRNLNENLVTEFSEKERLTSILEARTEETFATAYFGKDYSVHVKPIKGLPYYMVVFSDLSYLATREMEIYSFTFSMLFLLFGFFLLQLFVVFLVSSQRSFFKKQGYNTGWIAPKVSSHHQYNVAALFNLFVILLALAFFESTTFLTYVFILLFSVTSISLFLNALFAQAYKGVKPISYRFKITTSKWLLALMLLIHLVAFKTLDVVNVWMLLLYEIITGIAALFFFYRGHLIITVVKDHFKPQLRSKWNFKRSFALMALTRLIITSGIPVAFFYISAYNYEQNISIRYRQLQYAKKLIETIRPLNTATLQQASENSNVWPSFYSDGQWVSKVYIGNERPPLHRSEEDSITSKILDRFRLNFTDLAVREDRFSIPQADDSSVRYNPLLKDACRKDGITKTYLALPETGNYLTLEAGQLNYNIPTLWDTLSWYKGLLFWLLLLGGLLLFYLVVYNIIKKLFCLDLPDLMLWSGLDTKIISNKEINNLLFVIGLPGSKKLTRILEAINAKVIRDKEDKALVYNQNDPEQGNVVIADLIKIPDLGSEEERTAEWQRYADNTIFNRRNRLIIVNHFEYNIQDVVTNRIKLNFLEQLMVANQCKVIILSTVHPVAFLDSITDTSEGESKTGLHDLERWHVLLGHYRIILLALRDIKDEMGKDKKEPPVFNQTLYNETAHAHFLNQMQVDVLEAAKELRNKGIAVKSDELIYKVQVTAHYFYMYMWQSLTKEEKYLLFDLAEDNLVNGYDSYNLNMLIAKGAIIRENGTLKIFNRGFRNFILTAIGNSEAMKINKRIKDNGNWRNLRTTLLIILLATLAFLLSSQREAYYELMAYLGALGLGIPAVLKVFALFNKNGDKE
jgi:hypothetical protein